MAKIFIANFRNQRIQIAENVVRRCFTEQAHYLVQFYYVRYAMLVSLAEICPGKVLVPAYDIDVVWAVHKLKPHIYQEDMKRLEILFYQNHSRILKIDQDLEPSFNFAIQG